MAVWTHGRWTARPGREDDFLAVWTAMVEEVAAEVDVPNATLLRDRDRPDLFLTFARWESVEAIETFRAALRPRLEGMSDVLEDFSIQTLDEVRRGG